MDLEEDAEDSSEEDAEVPTPTETRPSRRIPGRPDALGATPSKKAKVVPEKGDAPVVASRGVVIEESAHEHDSEDKGGKGKGKGKDKSTGKGQGKGKGEGKGKSKGKGKGKDDNEREDEDEDEDVDEDEDEEDEVTLSSRGGGGSVSVSGSTGTTPPSVESTCISKAGSAEWVRRSPTHFTEAQTARRAARSAIGEFDAGLFVSLINARHRGDLVITESLSVPWRERIWKHWVQRAPHEPPRALWVDDVPHELRAAHSVLAITEHCAPGCGTDPRAIPSAALFHHPELQYRTRNDPKTRVCIVASDDLCATCQGGWRFPVGQNPGPHAEAVIFKLRAFPRDVALIVTYLAPARGPDGDANAVRVLSLIAEELANPSYLTQGLTPFLVGDFNSRAFEGGTGRRDRALRDLMRLCRIRNLSALRGERPEVTRHDPAGPSSDHVLDAILGPTSLFRDSAPIDVQPFSDGITDHLLLSGELRGILPAKFKDRPSPRPDRSAQGNRAAAAPSAKVSRSLQNLSPYDAQLLNAALLAQFDHVDRCETWLQWRGWSSWDDVSAHGGATEVEQLWDIFFSVWSSPGLEDRGNATRTRRHALSEDQQRVLRLARGKAKHGRGWRSRLPAAAQGLIDAATERVSAARTAVATSPAGSEARSIAAAERKAAEAQLNRRKRRSAATRNNSLGKNLNNLYHDNPAAWADVIDATVPGFFRPRGKGSRPVLHDPAGLPLSDDAAASALRDHFESVTDGSSCTVDRRVREEWDASRLRALNAGVPSLTGTSESQTGQPHAWADTASALGSPPGLPQPSPESIRRATGIASGPVSTDELGAALSSSQGRRSGGPNGLSSTALKAMFTAQFPAGTSKEDRDLCERLAACARSPLAAAFSICLRTGYIPVSGRTARVTPVPKKGKDRHSSEGFRPISVVNVEYKALLTVHGRRIREATASMIPRNQAAYQSGRSTTELGYTVLVSIQEAARQGKDVFIITSDLTKAFDRTLWSVQVSALAAAGVVGEPLRFTDAALHASRKMLTIGSSAPVHWRSDMGMPQGDPGSPTMFNISTAGILRHLDAAISEDSGHLRTANGSVLPDFAFADDLGLIVVGADYVEARLRSLATAASTAAQSTSSSKTMIAGFSTSSTPTAHAELLDACHTHNWCIDGTPVSFSVDKAVNVVGSLIGSGSVGHRGTGDMLKDHRESCGARATAKAHTAALISGHGGCDNSALRALFFMGAGSTLGQGRLLHAQVYWDTEWRLFKQAAESMCGVRPQDHINSLATLLEAGLLPPGVQQLAVNCGFLVSFRKLPADTAVRIALSADIASVRATDVRLRVKLLRRPIKGKLLLLENAASPWAGVRWALEELGIVDELVTPLEGRDPLPEDLTPDRARSLVRAAFCRWWTNLDPAGSRTLTWYKSIRPSINIDSPAWFQTLWPPRFRESLARLRLQALRLDEHEDRRRSRLASSSSSSLRCHLCTTSSSSDGATSYHRPVLDHEHLVVSCRGTRSHRASFRNRLLRLLRSHLPPQPSRLGNDDTLSAPNHLVRSRPSTTSVRRSNDGHHSWPAHREAARKLVEGISPSGDLIVADNMDHAALRHAWHRFLLGGSTTGPASDRMPFNHDNTSGFDPAVLSSARRLLGAFASCIVSTVENPQRPRGPSTLAELSAFYN